MIVYDNPNFKAYGKVIEIWQHNLFPGIRYYCTDNHYILSVIKDHLEKARIIYAFQEKENKQKQQWLEAKAKKIYDITDVLC